MWLLMLSGPLFAETDGRVTVLAEVAATVSPSAAQNANDKKKAPDERWMDESRLDMSLWEAETTYGKNSEEVFQVLQDLARSIENWGPKQRKYLEILQRMLSLARALRGDSDVETGKVLATYGARLELEKQDTQAEPLLVEALNILKPNDDAAIEKRLVALDALVRIYRRSNRIESALRHAQEALAIREKTLPVDRRDITLSRVTIESLKRSLRLQNTTIERTSDILLKKLASTLNQLTDLDKQVWEKNYLKKEKKIDVVLALSDQMMQEKAKVLGKEHPEVTGMLTIIAILYNHKRQFEKSRAILQQELSIFEKSPGPDQPITATVLIGIGHTYFNMGQYDQALPFYQKGLAIFEKVLGPESNYTAIGLDSLANLYTNLGQYGEALRLYKRSVAILDKNLEPERAKSVNCVGHNGLATLYARLGQYEKSLQLAQCQSAVTKKVWGPENPITAVSDAELVGLSYRATGRYDKALLAYQRRLAYFEDEHGPEDLATATSLIDLGELYQAMGQYNQALKYFLQGHAIREKLLGDVHPDTASSLNNLGSIYIALGQLGDAEKLLQDIVSRIVGNPAARETLWKTQRDLFTLYAKKQIPDLAILWGKEAINTIQSLRGEVKGLDQELQSGFLNDKRPVYQNLADLMIAEGRLVEAQEVLQMLKEQELHDSLQRAAKSDPRTTRIALTGLERKRFARYYEIQDQQIALGKEHEQLQHKQFSGQITSAELTRLNEINTKLLPSLHDAMQTFFTALQKASDQYTNGKDYRKDELPLALVETNLQKVFANVRQRDPTARVAALQYVVTDARLSILLSTPDAPPLARQIAFDGKGLQTQILSVREQLRNAGTDPALLIPQLQALYAQLIAPILQDLKATGATTLILVPNDVLRYVPFAALYDGKHYLVQDYTLTLFNEAVKKDFSANTPRTWQLAAMGLTHEVSDAGLLKPLPALPSVSTELKRISNIPGMQATLYLNDDFTHAALVRALGQDFNVLHLASHFQFVPGRPDASRLFLGDRSSLYLSEIARENLRFDHFSLVTFAACDSGLGGGLDADGREMESLGALVQNQGAQAVMSTLWEVEDVTTAALMEAFYRARNQAHLGKAAALRTAQLQLIAGGGEYAHPYYWAPYVLMGDWR